MSNQQRYNGHTISRMTVHLVWVTKYRYPVLQGDIQQRCRTLIMQICDTEDVTILKGVVSKDHVHIHLEYLTRLAISELMKRLKGRTSRLLQQGFTNLQKQYWGKHFWAIGYGAWSTGNITDEIVEKYLEHHRNPGNTDTSTIILE